MIGPNDLTAQDEHALAILLSNVVEKGRSFEPLEPTTDYDHVPITPAWDWTQGLGGGLPQSHDPLLDALRQL